VRTAGGAVIAREVVLATNTALASRADVAPHVTVFSSYALMTEAAGEQLAAMGWSGEEGFADLRMFLHYFRKTVDGRVLLGSGSGPIGYAGDGRHPAMTTDAASAARAARGLRRLFPALADIGIAKAWGGAIDVSSDRLPFFRTMPGTRVHYGCGYSGHGVNPTYIGGQTLADLALGRRSDWTALPFCTRTLPTLPPEPLRYIGGRMVRWGVLGCEEAEEDGRRPALARRMTAAIPRVFGLKVGMR
jgi:glycine/D-amino acid oxidase-like deaminating enzyme